MSDYQPGHIKHEPDTAQVAIRTIHNFPGMEWSIGTSSAGSRHAATAEVADWADLYTPPAADG